jgi:hypothetical protein
MKITKEDLLNSEFLKQFKDSGELDGFLSELHKRGIEKMLEGELDSHLGYERYSPEGKNTGNSRNGKTEKKIKTGFGESQIEVPRDRDGSFEPAIVPKRKGLAKGIEDLVISLYAKGMGNSDIEEQIREIYDFRLSTSTISNITSKIHQDILEWQSRPLDPVYLIVWMDGIVFKVRQSGKVINKTIYLAVGLNRDGKKEVLGMWLGETESASFWSGVLSDLQSRGLEDILITSTDNLKGFTDAIRSIFTGAVTQICVVHLTDFRGFIIPIIVWISPVLIIRYLSINLKFKYQILAYLAFVVSFTIQWRGMIPIPDPYYYLITFALSSYFFLPFAINNFLSRKIGGFKSTLILPVTWVVLEYLYSSFINPYYSWGSIAYTQFDNLPLLQIVSITGIYGITFIIGWFASVLNWIWENDFDSKTIQKSGSIFLLTFILVLLYGGVQLTFFQTNQETVRIASITSVIEEGRSNRQIFDEIKSDKKKVK